MIIFLDKLAIQRGHGTRQEYYRKRGKIRARRKMISISNRSKFLKISSKLFYSPCFSLYLYNFSFLIALLLIEL